MNGMEGFLFFKLRILSGRSACNLNFNVRPMKKYPVDSTAMTSVGYDADLRILEIQFKSGGALRQFFQVPQELFDQLMAADSLGDFFNTSINGKFEEKRIDE
jgi:hypothetical protein